MTISESSHPIKLVSNTPPFAAKPTETFGPLILFRKARENGNI